MRPLGLLLIAIGSALTSIACAIEGYVWLSVLSGLGAFSFWLLFWIESKEATDG